MTLSEQLLHNLRLLARTTPEPHGPLYGQLAVTVERYERLLATRERLIEQYRELDRLRDVLDATAQPLAQPQARTNWWPLVALVGWVGLAVVLLAAAAAA